MVTKMLVIKLWFVLTLFNSFINRATNFIRTLLVPNVVLEYVNLRLQKKNN